MERLRERGIKREMRSSQEIITYPSSKCRTGCGGDNFRTTNCGKETVHNFYTVMHQ